ncbi:MAG: AarF/ABC1/UbiB kinase family protein [Chromatiaceae bacterium]|nr:MAG: AarF/ABC1/UbiB kinase family protein [Chromatiaceae bacterium]
MSLPAKPAPFLVCRVSATPSRIAPGRAVPGHRLARLWHLGRAGADLAAGIGLRGMAQMVRGEAGTRIAISPAAARRLTDRLARMRGAVMKMGQLMSMDGSDILTPEATAIMASLRERAEPMPLSQLHQVLRLEWGEDWPRGFRRFEFQPLAAASIGQVHRAETCDGRRLAIKVQFPGVAASIDSDIANLGLLVRGLGLLPPGLAPEPLLAEAREQLHREADYVAEAAALAAYGARLADDPQFFVPRVHPDLSTPRVLAMDFAPGVPVDRLAAGAPASDRDRVAASLSRLVLQELFEFGLMQTDPNFGNYLYDAASGRISLLDFGATATVPPVLAGHYRDLARAALASDRARIRAAAIALGYLAADATALETAALVELILLAGEVLRQPGRYDFATSDLFERVYRRGRDLFLAERFSRLPAPGTLFLHRKLVGTFMLCRRLQTGFNVQEMVGPYL